MPTSIFSAPRWHDDWRPPPNNMLPGIGPDIVPRELRGKKMWTLDDYPPSKYSYDDNVPGHDRELQRAVYQQKADEATPSPNSHQSEPSPGSQLESYHPNTTRKRKEVDQEKEMSEELGLEEKMMGAAGSLDHDSAITEEEYSIAQEEEKPSSTRKETMTPTELSGYGRRPLQPLVMPSDTIEEEHHSSFGGADDGSHDEQAAPPQRIIKRISHWVEEIYEPDQNMPESSHSAIADESPCPTQGPKTLKRTLGSPFQKSKKRKTDVEDSDDDLPSSAQDTVGAKIINGFSLLEPAVALARDIGQGVRRRLNPTHTKKTKRTATHDDGDSPPRETDAAELQRWWHPGRASADDTASMQDPIQPVQTPADVSTPVQSDKENVTPTMTQEERLAEDRRNRQALLATQEDHPGDFIHLPLMGFIEDQESPSHRVSRARIGRQQKITKVQRYEPYGRSGRAQTHARTEDEVQDDASDYSDAPTAEISEPPASPLDHPTPLGTPQFSPITPAEDIPAPPLAPLFSPLTPAEDDSPPPTRRKVKGNKKKKAKKTLNMPSNRVSKKPSVRKAKAPLVPLSCKTRSKSSSDTKFMALDEKCTPIHLFNPPCGRSWRRAQKVLF